MQLSKEQIIKDIMSIRRRIDVAKGAGIREIDIFEEQVAKSTTRIEQVRYLAKKYNQVELVEIHKAYEELRSK
ncbi:MAG: hypothetical protein RR324_05945 [Cellulosilyticaceae bacterium]